MTTAFRELKKLTFGHFLDEDEDVNETIESRIQEIHSMVKPKMERINYNEQMDQGLKDKLITINMTSSSKTRRLSRRMLRKSGRFRHTVKIMVLLNRACMMRRKYFHDGRGDSSTLTFKRFKPDQITRNVNVGREYSRSSIGSEMQLALATQPEYRKGDHLKRVLWVLRTTGAFRHLFPFELQQELARVVGYERYDSDRVMATQGSVPERFYYILTGKVRKVKEYNLMSGHITRSGGMLEKGSTTDSEELEMQWLRECHLITKGYVEVLVIHRDDFLRLQHTIQGPPIEYLRSLSLFKEFPCEEFQTCPDAIEFKYYGPDKLVIKDTQVTPWIFIIKSGYVKVLRKQYVIDVQNENKFANQSTEELGYGRSFSHAAAMLGLLPLQRKNRSKYSSFLPEIMKRRKPVSALDLQSGKSNEDSAKTKENKRKELKNTELEQVQKTKKAVLIKQPIIVDPSGRESRSCRRLETIAEKNEELSSRASKPSSEPSIYSTSLPPIKTPEALPNSGKSSTMFHPHGTYMTREETQFDPVYMTKPDSVFKEKNALRPAHLQLDILKPGDIFGLEHIETQNLESEHGLSLVSDGAEVIKISKRFFLQHAKNNTMLRVETLQREYMNTEEARDILYHRETWNQYKHMLMKRLVGRIELH